MKDYYAILGVSPNAEPEVISAAYKSLAKKYHPDVYQGTKKEVEKRIREINEAYSYLSNQAKKKKYDKEYSQNKNAGSFNDFNENEFEDNHDIIDKDWEVLIEIFPNAEKLRISLSKLSQKLGLLFQVILLEKKMGGRAQEVASNLKNEFLERYFGKNKKIQELATKALINNEIDIAKEINSKITLLGDDAAQKIYYLLSKKLEDKLKLKKEKNSSRKPKSSNEKNNTIYRRQKNYRPPLIVLFCFLIFLIITLNFLNRDYVSYGSWQGDPCIINPEKCSDSELCEHATYLNSDGSYEWNQWSEAHVDLAKEKNLICNTVNVNENNLSNSHYSNSNLSKKAISRYQKEACMENPANCNDEFLCYFATEVVNGIFEWHSVATEYVNLAKNKNLICKVGQSF